MCKHMVEEDNVKDREKLPKTEGMLCRHSLKFRQYHLCAVLKSFELQQGPLDAHLSRYFRANKALGSKDRAFIGDTLYHYIRWKNLYDYLNLDPTEEIPQTLSLPPHIQCG